MFRETVSSILTYFLLERYFTQKHMLDSRANDLNEIINAKKNLQIILHQ
jgi:hypothetical protein